MIIDTHSHLFDEAFSTDREEVISSCRANGISKIIMPAIDSDSYDAMENLSDMHPDYLFPTMGLHPTSVTKNWKKNLETVRARLFGNPDKYVAVGEIGMDLYWSSEYFVEQCEALQQQAMWSLELRKPLILHVRKAYNEVFPVLDPFAGKLRGVFHSFEGEEKDLERINRIGNFYIGVGGVATYKKRVAKLLKEKVPLSRIILETDSPYLTPSPLQGERNSTLNLPIIVKKLSDIYSVSESDVERITSENAQELFWSMQ